MTLALVTGATGFVGGHALARLAAAGFATRALVRRDAALPRGTELARGDLRDERALAEAVRGAGVVVHCAAVLDPVPDAETADQVNHRATVALARAAARAGAWAFLHVSSIAAIGFRADAGLVPPGAACAPETDYGRSKRAAEEALLELDAGDMRIAILRPPTVYGTGERRNFLALTRAVRGSVLPIPGRGENRMSFCHATNLADALVWAAREEAARGILHVADATPVTLRQAIGAIGRALGRPPFLVPLPMPVARLAAVACEVGFGLLRRPPPLSRRRLGTLTADCALDTRDTAALGFRPAVSFEAGVAETVAWYRAEGLVEGRA